MQERCGNGVQANTVNCTLCKRWIYKRYSGERRNQSLVIDGFRCKRCDGTIQEADGWKNIIWKCKDLL